MVKDEAMQQDTLQPADVLLAAQRINGLVAHTPVERSAPLSLLAGAEVFFKLESIQTTGSFKLRGATNALRTLGAANGEQARIVACSAGNHALGVAHAAAALGVDALLVLPEHASPAKVAALRRYPVELRLHGATYDDAEAEALRIAHDDHRHFLSPYNDRAVIAGAGTVALELLEQLPQCDVLLVPVGGGGLMSGVLLWAKAVKPAIRVIGIQPEASAVMAASLQAGRMVTLEDQPSLADGLAGGVDSHTITLPILQTYLDEMLLVSETAIANAMRWLMDEHHLLVEGSGAVGVAALLGGQVSDITGRHVAALLTGRNVATQVVQSILNDSAN